MWRVAMTFWILHICMHQLALNFWHAFDRQMYCCEDSVYDSDTPIFQGFTTPSFDDKIIEVVAIFSCSQMVRSIS